MPDQAVREIVPAVALPAAVIENQLAKLELDARGRCIALIEKHTARNLLAKTSPMATVKVNGNLLRPTMCSYTDGKLSLRFGKGEVKVVLQCACKKRYLTFTVLSVEGEGVESLAFLSLPLQPGKHLSSTSGGCSWGRLERLSA